MTIHNGFKESQLRNKRVKEAFIQKEAGVNSLLLKNNIQIDKLELFIRIIKSEKLLEIWGKNSFNNNFVLLCTYQFCAMSGSLGPKRMQGDLQTPEGIYYINRFNPQSSYHLSLGINYPNKADKLLSTNGNPGGDIFIHGNCVTIGCIPITDDKIKELYVLCVIAKNNGQENIPVHIYPGRLDNANADRLFEPYQKNQVLIKFWKELKVIYEYFEEQHAIPNIKINVKGEYVI